MSNFNPEIPNQPVQHIHNPGIRGVTTGMVREDGTDLYIHIQIGINDKKWYPHDDLELIGLSFTNKEMRKVLANCWESVSF